MLGFEVDGLMDAMGVFYYILVYGIGIVAMTLSTIAYQFRHRITIILSNLFGQCLWVVYFLLQGDLTSAIACALSAIMLAVFAKKGEWKWASSPFTVGLFIVLISGFSLLSFQGWIDVFPLLAGVFAVIANSQTNETRLRWFALFWCLFWLFNSLLKGYPVALASDILCTSSTIVALIRYRKKRNEGKEDDLKLAE